MVNYLAVLVAAFVSYALGALWYGPLFGKKWIALTGMTNKDMQAAKEKGMGKTYAIGFVSTLVMTYVLARLIESLGTVSLSAGLTTAFWAWLGFVATIGVGGVLWEKKPLNLYFLNMAHWLVAMLVMGLILGVWA